MGKWGDPGAFEPEIAWKDDRRFCIEFGEFKKFGTKRIVALVGLPGTIPKEKLFELLEPLQDYLNDTFNIADFEDEPKCEESLIYQ